MLLLSFRSSTSARTPSHTPWCPLPCSHFYFAVSSPYLYFQDSYLTQKESSHVEQGKEGP